MPKIVAMGGRKRYDVKGRDGNGEEKGRSNERTGERRAGEGKEPKGVKRWKMWTENKEQKRTGQGDVVEEGGRKREMEA